MAGQQDTTKAATTTTVEKAKGTALEAVVKATEERIAQIDAAAARYRSLSTTVNHYQLALLTARTIKEIRDSMGPEIVAMLKTLMNSPLGFITDHGPHAYRDDYKACYDDETMKSAALEAVVHGVLWTGNHFNILAGRCYITKEGYAYKLSTLEGLSNLNVVPSVPVIREGQTIVRVCASWIVDGKSDQLIDQEGKPGRNFPIIVNKAMGVDAVIGKAFRKAYKAVWEKIHGSERTPVDGDVEDFTPQKTVNESRTLDDLAARIAAGNTTDAAPVSPPVEESNPVEPVKSGTSELFADDGDPLLDAARR